LELNVIGVPDPSDATTEPLESCIEEELRHVDFKLEPLEWVLYAYTIMLKVDNLIDLELGSDLGLIHCSVPRSHIASPYS